MVHRWSKGMGSSNYDYGYDVAADANGNVYVTGYFSSYMTIDGTTLLSKGGYDAYVAAFTPSGNLRWAKSIGGSSSDYGYGIAVDNSGNVYVTGRFYNYLTFGTTTLPLVRSTATVFHSGLFDWPRSSLKSDARSRRSGT